jgi:hypothetical protein
MASARASARREEAPADIVGRVASALPSEISASMEAFVTQGRPRESFTASLKESAAQAKRVCGHIFKPVSMENLLSLVSRAEPRIAGRACVSQQDVQC